MTTDNASPSISASPARPETPKDLADVGYRIEVGAKEDGELAGRCWWTWSNGGDVIASEGDWSDPQAAILNARSNWSILGETLKREETCDHDEAGRA